MNALSIDGLTVAYGSQPVLVEACAEASCGELTAIMGPNGAGKTTMIRAALDLVPRVKGQCLFLGQPLAEVRSRVSYIAQRGSVDWEMPLSVLDVVLMGSYARSQFRLWRSRAKEREALECLARVEMEQLAGRQIGQLSGGQKQRVFVARALMQRADVLLLDEPFAGIDVLSERQILNVLTELASRGVAVIVVHHDPLTIGELFDKVIVVNRRVIYQGPARAALSDSLVQEAYRLGSWKD